MKRLLLLLLCLCPLSLMAQLSHGGAPLLQESKSPVPTLTLPALNNADYLRQDMEGVPGASPLRLGVMRQVNISSFDNGSMQVLADGTRVWRMAVRSPGATFIALYFSQFDLPEGASLFVYNDDMAIGSFNASNRLPDGTFFTQSLPGDHCVIEYQVPASVKETGHWQINRIMHGYKPFNGRANESKDRMGMAGDCHINVACSDADPYRDQVRSVVCMLLATEKGAYFCSGALINNTANDKTPYILSAYHCQDLPDPLVGITFYFNYQATSCDNDWVGPNNQTLIGAEIVAKETPSGGSDMLLMRLYDAVPDTYQPYYAGWDRNVVERPRPGFAIHHPAGDFKKISIPYTLRQGQGQGVFSQYPVNLVKYYKAEWTDKGIIEGGSSGSPLFNDQKLIIGQLSAGHGDCSDTYNAEAWYGRFASDWVGAGTAATRVSDWLDPLNTGVKQCQGLNYDATVKPPHIVNANELHLYPNPGEGMMRVDVEEIGEATYQVFNTQGFLVYEGTTIFATTTQAINLTFLPSGAYIIHLHTQDADGNDKLYANTFIIKKQ